MNRKTLLLSALISSIVAMVTAAAVFVVLFNRYGDVKMGDPPESSVDRTPTLTPPVESKPFPSEDIKAADVESLTIETVYKNFFASGDKCRQSYNEYFKKDDGFWSISSPCSVKLTVNRDGSMEKTIEVRRYDRGAKQSRVVEKNVWKARLTAPEFNDFAESIVTNEAFKRWNNNISLYVSNCKISVRHKNGTKSPMSNVDEKTTSYLPMVDDFKKLDAKAGWEKVE